MAQLNTPVALIIFKRPETTARVFAEIAKARPSKLLVIADGPRPEVPHEAQLCEATRLIVEKIHWDCEVFRNYSDVNLGCGLRPATGLDWVFTKVDEAIILEDDCLPHASFFKFCEELLDRYRQDERIMMISGNNFQIGAKQSEYSYYFSGITHCWGWATWKVAWERYDYYMNLWPEIKKRNWLTDLVNGRRPAKYWEGIFDGVYEGRLTTVWDYQWFFSCLINHGLSIVPSVNLVKNIGFGAEATHTEGSDYLSIEHQEMQFPLKHPPFIIRDWQADKFEHKIIYQPSLFERIKMKAKNIFHMRPNNY